MKPSEIFAGLTSYLGRGTTSICDIHSLCSPTKKRLYMCGRRASSTPVADFDALKEKFHQERRSTYEKSVDAVAPSSSDTRFCFVELKSWDLLVQKGDEQKIRKKGEDYESDLPEKLRSSIKICQQIMKDDSLFDDNEILFILVSDIPDSNPLGQLVSNLTALAGTASDLTRLCNELSENALDKTRAKVANIATRYWNCRNFDTNLAQL